MGKYTVTHTCGHVVEVQLFGPEAGRRRTLDWMAKGECKACERAAETAAADKASEAMGLPALTGSEKQVVWAAKIRIALLGELKSYCDKMLQKGVDKDLPPEKREMARQHAAALEDRAARIIDAGWWIDNRNNPGSVIASKVHDMIKTKQA